MILGDAVCTFNPLFGQGMTVALLGAERLDRELAAHLAEHRDLRGFGRRFQRSLDGVVNIPWQTALMQDRLWVSADAKPSLSDRASGAGSLSQRVSAAASARLLDVAFSNIDVWIQFMRVNHLLDSPLKMLSPKVLLPIVRGSRGPLSSTSPHVGTLREAPGEASAVSPP